MYGGRSSILHVGPLIETNHRYAPYAEWAKRLSSKSSIPSPTPTFRESQDKRRQRSQECVHLIAETIWKFLPQGLSTTSSYGKITNINILYFFTSIVIVLGLR